MTQKNRSLNIVFITNNFPKLSETFVLTEFLGLLNQGQNVEVLANNAENDVTHGAINKYQLKKRTHYSSESQKSFTSACLKFIANYIKHSLSYSTYKTLRKLIHIFGIGKNSYLIVHYFNDYIFLKEKNYDIIYSPFSPPYLIKRVSLLSHLVNRPYALGFRAFDIYKKNNQAELKRVIPEMKNADLRFTIAEYNKQYLQEEFGITQPIHILHSPVECDFFKSIKKPAINTKKVIRIICVGRFVEKKGICHLLSALKELNKTKYQFECVLVGRGPELDNYKAQIKRLKLANIIFTGALPREKVKEEYQNAHIAIFPCIIAENNNTDVLPNVVKEAMLMTVPVITTNISGIKEMVSHKENGYLIKQKSSKEIVNAVLELINNKKLYEKIQKNSRKIIETDFNVQIESKKMLTYFEETVFNKKCSSTKGK